MSTTPTLGGTTLPDPSAYSEDIANRGAYREMAECLDESELDAMSNRWADRFGRLPAEAANLLDISRLRLIAGGKGVENIEIKGQRLMLQRNGDYILLEGGRFPRLDAVKPRAKLDEALALLRSL